MGFVTDKDIEERMRPVLKELSRYFKPRVRIEKKAQQPAPSSQAKVPTKPSREMVDYMESIIDLPNLSVTARATRLGLSSNKNNRIKKALLGLKLITSFTVDLGKSYGGRVTLLRLTNEGYQALKLDPPKNQKGIHQRESLEHLFWKEVIYRTLSSKGYKAEIEYELNGKEADIAYVKDGIRTAVEIELSPKNCVRNLKRNIEAGFHKTISACKNHTVMKAIETRVDAFADENNIDESRYQILLLSELELVKDLHKEIRG